ncbi:MAG: protein BatD [PVC group bacterium]|nr:protein BatD [PVC group bacterium]
MKKRTVFRIKILWTIVFILLFVGQVLAAEPTVSLATNKKALGVGDKADIILSIKWTQDDASDIIVKKITPPASEMLKLVDSKEQTETQLTEKGVFAKRIITYTYKAIKQGNAKIEPAVIEYVFKSTPEETEILRSDPIVLAIESFLMSWAGKMLWWIFMLFSIIVGPLVTIFIFRKILYPPLKKTDEAGLNTVLETKTLEEIKEHSYSRVTGETKEYYSRMQKTVTAYIDGKHGKTKSDVPDDLQTLSLDWKEIAEKVSFSGYAPSRHEQEALVRRTEKYFSALLSENNTEDDIDIIEEKEE